MMETILHGRWPYWRAISRGPELKRQFNIPLSVIYIVPEYGSDLGTSDEWMSGLDECRLLEQTRYEHLSACAATELPDEIS